MTTKTYEEFMSEINSMNIKEALKNAEKCLEAFTPEDIIKQQQETIESQKAEIERLCVELDEVIIAKDLLFDEAEALIKNAKAEAVKEFVMRFEKKVKEAKFTLLKEVENELVGTDFTKTFIGVKKLEPIPNNKKEMVGEG